MTRTSSTPLIWSTGDSQRSDRSNTRAVRGGPAIVRVHAVNLDRAAGPIRTVARGHLLVRRGRRLPRRHSCRRSAAKQSGCACRPGGSSAGPAPPGVEQKCQL
jgi:hypothetical protein